MGDIAPDTLIETRQTGEARAPNRLFALKDKDTFMVADAFGDITGDGDGLFHNDTRILSRFRLLLGKAPPSLLSGAIGQENVFFTSNGANQALPFLGDPAAPSGVLHIERRRFLWEERLYERIRIFNYSRDVVETPLVLEMGADFRDMFELRGATRPRRGLIRPPETDERSVRYSYEGLDGVERASIVAFSEPPRRMSHSKAEFVCALDPEGRFELFIEVGACSGPAPGGERFREASIRARWDMRRRRRHGARLRSSGRLFNEWLDRSRSDLALLTTRLETGPYPYAGIPWFSTAFGRDAIITCLQILWFEPSLARGVLTYLAAHQAEEVSTFRDAAPGKIMHETRKGEMPAVGEVPFARYYGGVDTTPLFIVLAGAYAERTGDDDLIDALWPALKAAADWIERFGDSTGDGLIDYARGEDSGLANQGWKDSEDSVFHADGQFPAGPIALVEVQGYAFAAFRAMAGFAERRGDAEAARHWRARAEHLREVVEKRFWMPDKGFYGMAIDGQGELCCVLGSNSGHLLYVGLPEAERGKAVAEHLLSSRFATGWGLRTLATGEARFNPMSYHNGSVWPHDTALCVMGMANYGERDGVVRMMSHLFETASHFEMRLPELFCGFSRAAGEPPVAYPVACLPQAWAAGSIFMMLQACLGLKVNGAERRVEVVNPRLPIGIDRLVVEDLRVGPFNVRLSFEGQGAEVAVRVEAPEGVTVSVS